MPPSTPVKGNPKRFEKLPRRHKTNGTGPLRHRKGKPNLKVCLTVEPLSSLIPRPTSGTDSHEGWSIYVTANPEGIVRRPDMRFNPFRGQPFRFIPFLRWGDVMPLWERKYSTTRKQNLILERKYPATSVCYTYKLFALDHVNYVL